ncbi:MAG: hypothetical protein KJ999_21315 [Gammaproteobacteria bacterium]|nr:hypothetical protein [Gammaproteobacteria bacterium]
MYIELQRTFRELRTTGQADDAAALIQGSETLTLQALLQERRVVVLSEGGSGKTWELQEAAKRLRSEGKAAFFLRLEHVVRGFDGAFDAGNLDEFSAWLASTEPGWLLLDSIDESRLRSPQDFEAALRVVNARLANAKDRAYVLVSGRPSAWRPRTDLELCTRLFPLASGHAELPGQDAATSHHVDTTSSAPGAVFKIVALESLSPTQVEAFAVARGVQDIKPFLDAIERGDAWSFAQRPQDLEDLVGYWIDNGKLGSRLEWMAASVDRRLQESQDRAEARPLTPTRAREGVEKLAAALILTRLQNIRVPDGQHRGPGLKAREVLGWDDSEIATLLQRPLFNQDVYGTVRFHHRSVLEYLGARWFVGLLQREVSRRWVEELFFREQYGLQVVVPSLRPLLPWLAIADDRVRARIRSIAPEIVFEGGDPQRLPADLRSAILDQVCEQFAAGTSGRSMADHNAIQRFAAPDVSDTVRRLIHAHRDHEEVISFLMCMVWQGGIAQALPEVLDVAQAAATPQYARIAAFHAVDAVGTPSDMVGLRARFAHEGEGLNRRCMAELLSLVKEPDAATLQWIMACVPRLAEFDEHDHTGLSREMARYFERAEVDLSAQAIDRLHALLVEPPFIDRHHSSLSVRYRWLQRTTGAVLSRLIRSRHDAALRPSAVAALHVMARSDAYDPDHQNLAELGLPQLVQDWPRIKWAWFWDIIERQRASDGGAEVPVVAPWQAWVTMHPVGWDEDDFGSALAAIAERPLADDKLVALEIAIRLYTQSERQPAYLQQMEVAVGGDAALRTRLQLLLNPPEKDEALIELERESAKWTLRSKRRAEQIQRQRRKNVEQLSSQLDTLRKPGFSNPSGVSQSQAYLLDEMRRLEEGKGSHWTVGQWRCLQEEFGADTALAFRDGVVAFWRKHTPQLISEGAEINTVPLPDLFGLAGLTIEAAETSGLMSTLSSAEARVAFRYAMRELNGFPHWFADLCSAHPDVVTEMARTEIEFELQMDVPESASHYLIADIRHTGEWLANRLAPHLLQVLTKHTSHRPRLMEYVVDILMVSELPNAEIAEHSSSQMTGGEEIHRPLWAAAWTSIEPGPAIDAVQQHVETLTDAQQRTKFIMAFAAHLLGSRTTSSRMRTAYQTPAVLKRLYLLVHQHVRADEDINRAGKGVYSPGLRDNAQEARELLVQTLSAIQGREAFLALHAISEDHPQPSWRPWFVQKAVAKAQADSERPAWSEKQVSEFAETFERAPANHRELFDLAVMRLLDLKHEMEDSDQSTASVVIRVDQETQLRNWIASWCSRHAHGLFNIPQEHELPDAKRPDLRWTCSNIEGAVPAELKIADNWTGAQLFERLEGQLAGDYLRDDASSRGIYLLVWRGAKKERWQIPGGGLVNFAELLDALQAHWKSVGHTHPQVEEIRVIGIDLTKRAGSTVPMSMPTS